MAELFSQYASGVQFTAGTIVGSTLGISGINPMVDRLNSITTDNNVISAASGVIGGIWNTPGASFLPTTNSQAWTRDRESINEQGTLAADSSMELFKDINEIPHNANVGSVNVFAVENANQVNIEVQLARNDITGAGAVSFTVLGSDVGSGTSWQFIGSPTILDRENFTYYLRISGLDSNTVIKGASIKYSP